MKTINQMKEENYGSITSETIKDLVELDPNYMVLIRCGSCRLTCKAMDVEHLVEIIDESSNDYVRDVSFLAS